MIQFRNAVADFAQKEIAPRAAEVDRSNNFPMVNKYSNCAVHRHINTSIHRIYGRSLDPWACWVRPLGCLSDSMILINT